MGVFKLQQLKIRREIKRQIKRGVSEDDLHVISIHPNNASDLNWQKENEFIYQGNMYDVVRKEVLEDATIVYHCINDKQEAQLFANLDEMVKKHMDTDSPANKTAKKLFKIFSLSDVQELHKWASIDFNSTTPLSRYINHYISSELSIEGPPPKEHLFHFYI